MWQKINARDIRTMFELMSINFTTKRYGHGAGMRQYRANFMAQVRSIY